MPANTRVFKTAPAPEVRDVPVPGVELRCPWTGAEQKVVCKKREDGSVVYRLQGGLDAYSFAYDRAALETALRSRPDGVPAANLECPYTGHPIFLIPYSPPETGLSGFVAAGQGFNALEWRSSLPELLRLAAMRAGRTAAPASVPPAPASASPENNFVPSDADIAAAVAEARASSEKDRLEAEAKAKTEAEAKAKTEAKTAAPEQKVSPGAIPTFEAPGKKTSKT